MFRLRRAVEMLPDDFAMAGSVAAWKHLCGDGKDEGSAPVRRALGLDAGHRRALAEDLAAALDDNASPARIAGAVSALAEALSPERPDAVAMELLQAAGLAALGPRLSLEKIREAAHLLIPRDRVESLIARVQLMMDHRLREDLHPDAALRVLSALRDEHAVGRQGRAIARGCVLESLARTAFETRGEIGYTRQKWDDLSRLLGHEIENFFWVAIDLLAASLRADPLNRDGYRYLCELVRRGAPGKGRLEPLLQQMANRFPP